MAPKINVFEYSIRMLKLMGIVEPSNRKTDRLFMIWNSILILCGIESVVDVFLGTIFTKNNLDALLENLTLAVSSFSCSFTHFLFSWKKREIFALIRRVNATLEKVEDEVGTRKTSELKWFARIVHHFYSGALIGQVVVYYLLYFVKYFFGGVRDSSPFEIYFPFDKSDRIVQVALFNFVLCVHPVMSLILGKTVFGSFTAVIRGALEATERRFRQINPENSRKYIGDTLRQHAEIIQIMKEYNALFGSVFLMEYLLSMVFISTSGFLLIRVQSYADTEWYRYLGIYLSLVTYPLFTCICGHLIWDQNEKLYESIYDNEWYRLTPDVKKQMLLPTLLSGKGLNVNYKNIVRFNLALYLDIVKQSYSFLTFMKLISS